MVHSILQSGKTRWLLPPLILHPFADQTGPGKLLESSKAALMLCGAIENNEYSRDQLTLKLLEGRFSEIRMLYFLGRDLLRWTGQCVEFISSIPELSGKGIEDASFASFLTHSPPHTVQTKLKRWGVNDYPSVFARAIGLNAVFHEPPEMGQLTDTFIKHYHRFADHMFACRQQMTPFTEIGADQFDFELFASGEYSRMLETQWSAD